jgi:hypothetical protein
MKKQTLDAKKLREIQALAEKTAIVVACAPHAGRPFYTNFDEYVADYPEGEGFRAWLTRDGRVHVTLLAMDRPDLHNCLPGSYLAATIDAWTTRPKNGPAVSGVQLTVRDNDDGLMVKNWVGTDTSEAVALLEEMKALAPFTARECLTIFGLEHP